MVFTVNTQTIRRSAPLQRGAASVEAAIVLPVFVILFVSLFYVRNHILARQSADIHARSCAWAYSMTSCQDVPPGCGDTLRVGSQKEDLRQNVSDKLDTIGSGLIKDAIMAVLNPVLSVMLGRSLDANTEASFEQPGLYGDGTATTHGHYHLACNLKSQDPLDVVKNVWNSVF